MSRGRFDGVAGSSQESQSFQTQVPSPGAFRRGKAFECVAERKPLTSYPN